MKVINVYVRHSDSCKYRENRYSKKCSCPIWLEWTQERKQFKLSVKGVHKELHGVFCTPEQSKDWDFATSIAHQWQTRLEQVAAGETRAGPIRLTLAAAIEKYLAVKEELGVTDGTLGNNRRILGQLQTYCDGERLTLLRDVKATLIEDFQAGWEVNRLSKSVYQTILAGFFNWSCKRKSITGLANNPMDEVDRIKLTEKDKVQTPPYTAEEMSKILAAVPRTAAKHNWFPWKERRMRALILLQRYSGLAANDAVCLERSMLNLETAQVKTYRTKTGNYVGVKLPQFVVDAILACHDDGCERYFFWSGGGERSTAASSYAANFKQVLDEAGVQYEHSFLKSHRLRDTFAVEFLSNGGLMEELAELLGHSSVDTTRAHYNPWDVRRQARLDAAVEKSWDSVEMAKQVAALQPQAMTNMIQ